MDYEKTCFVIMPFGKKKVGGEEVDFDFIYNNVFKPAIEAVDLPADEGGGKLLPRRTDQDYFAGDIAQDMFEYIEYSRFALADISGLNANVFYEIGVRHRAHESGTAVFRQESGPPPFDIGQIKAFPYNYQPQDKVSESVSLITRVLTESLVHNRLDSPPMKALRAQREQEKHPQFANIEPLLIEADNAMRLSDWTTATDKYSEALRASPKNMMVYMKRGLIYRDQGEWAEAVADFTKVVELSPEYAEAHREKGIAENKAYNSRRPDARPPGMPSGEESLLRAIELKADDYDALSSLGGVYKREGRLEESAEMYRRATEASHGHTYPLLNEIKLKAHVDRRLALDAKHKFMLNRAKGSLKSQVEKNYNAPWSAFDLAEVCLYTGNAEGFLENVDKGLEICTARWQPETFRKSLELLTSVGVSLPGLDEGIAKLKETEEFLP